MLGFFVSQDSTYAAGNHRSDEGREQAHRYNIAQFFYFCGRKIYRNDIESGFRTTHYYAGTFGNETVRAIE